MENPLPIGRTGDDELPEPNVPVFRCLIYIQKLDNGLVRGLCANLPDLEVTGNDERFVLSKIVPAFKQRVIKFKQDGEKVPWIEPPTPIQEGQDKRVVPVHL